MFKGKWFWSAVPIAVVLILMLILMSYGPMYQAGVYDAAETVLLSGARDGKAPSEPPQYEITEEGRLLARGDWYLLQGDDPPSAEEWVDLGPLLKVKLNRSNFDKLFGKNGDWAGDADPASLRKRSVQTWGIVYRESVQYYLLQQKGGGVFLVSGYYDSERGGRASDDPSLSLVLRLEKEEAAGGP